MLSQKILLLSMKIQKELETFRRKILKLEKDKIYNKARDIQLMEDFAGVIESSEFSPTAVNKMLKTENILSTSIKNYDDDELISTNIHQHVENLYN